MFDRKESDAKDLPPSVVDSDTWPINELETVLNCPACGSTEKLLLLSDVDDLAFGVARGGWDIYKCKRCSVGYLSPRPTSNSIYKAYSVYYTHSSTSPSRLKVLIDRLNHALSKLYYDARFRKYSKFINILISSIFICIYPYKLYLDAKARHIYNFSQNGTTLDVGCGNGKYLKFLKKRGFSVKGIDIDPEAVDAASETGLDVAIGDIHSISEKGEKFDIITLSHIIEHVYDPAELISTCYLLLNPGGILWIETPNICSIGLDIYKQAWRGLEPPRHLILFNKNAMTTILQQAGYVDIEYKCHGLAGIYMAISSERLLRKCRNNASEYISSLLFLLGLPFRIIITEVVQLLFPSKREFLTLIAKKKK